MNRSTIAVLIAALAGCAGSGGTDGTDSSDGTDTTDGTDATDATDDTDVAALAKVTGTIRGPDGEPFGARVNVCLDTCFSVASDPVDGTYSYPADFDADAYWFYVVPVGEYPVVAASSVPIVLEPGDDVTLDVQLPAVEEWLPLPPMAEPIAFPGGLSLTVGLDSLDSFDGRTRVAAAVVDPSQLAGDLRPPGTVVAAWYLQPLEAKAKDGTSFTFEIEDTWAGGEGSMVDVYAGQYAWDKVGSFTVTDGKISGQGPSVLASLIVVVP